MNDKEGYSEFKSKQIKELKDCLKTFFKKLNDCL